MANNIVLSICIPTYNRRDLVCENVQKMLQYQGDDIEIIVNDNGSADGTVEALSRIEDGRLRIYQSETNKGASWNYLKVRTYATGQYVTLVNDRDWIEHQDIEEFVLTYKQSGCDFIVSSISKENAHFMKGGINEFDEKVWILLRCNHPGETIVTKDINEQLTAKFMEIENKECRLEDYERDIYCFYYALCIYGKRWESFKQLVQKLNPGQVANVKQLRGKTSAERNYFTPEGRLYRLLVYINNPYIHYEDQEMYLSVLYRHAAYGSLCLYRYFKSNPRVRGRYDFDAEATEHWAKIACTLYREAVKALKENGKYTHRLAVRFGLITIKEYLRLYAQTLVKVKKKFFPKPWKKK